MATFTKPIALLLLMLLATAQTILAQTVILDVQDELFIVRPDGTKTPKLEISGEPGQSTVLAVKVANWQGAAEFQTSETVTLDGTGKATLPLADRYPTLGIKYVDVQIGQGEAARHDWMTFAYLNPPGPQPAGEAMQFGMNSHSVEKWIKASSLAGAGIVRMGGDLREIRPEESMPWNLEPVRRQLDLLDRYGLQAQMLVAYGIPWATAEKYHKFKEVDGKIVRDTSWPHGFIYPVVPPVFEEFITRIAETGKGRIKYYEIWNEPDIDPFYAGTTDEYLEMLRTAHRVIKKVDPAALVGTGGFAFAPEDWLARVSALPTLQADILRTAQDAFDVHIMHIHGDFNSYVHRVDNILLPLRKKLGVTAPLLFNETGFTAHERQNEIDQAATLVKKATFAFARGAKAYFWFIMWTSPNQVASEYGYSMYRGEAETAQPKAVYAAHCALTGVLRGKHFVEQLDLGNGRWGFRFADDAETLTYQWQQDVREPEAAFVFDAPAKSERIDLMGNMTEIPTVDRRVLFVPTESPSALRIASSQNAAAKPIAMIQPAGALELDNNGNGRLVVDCANPLNRPITITLRLQSSGAAQPNQIKLAPKQSGQAVISVAEIKTAGTTGETGKLEFTVADTDWEGSLNVPITRVFALTDQQADGREADFVLDKPSQVTDFFTAMPDKAHLLWKNADDLSAKVWVSKAGDAIRIVAQVRDDQHVQPFKGQDIWKADSVQIGLSVVGREGYLELGMAQGDSGESSVAVWSKPTGMDDPAAKLDVSIKPAPGGLRYEMSIPMSLWPDADHIHRMRFNIAINDADDANGRKAAIALTPGLVSGKNPGEFVTLKIRD